MKVYVVQFSHYEGYSCPIFVGDSKEKAEKCIDLMYENDAKKYGISKEECIEKYYQEEYYYITELEMNKVEEL